MKTYIRLILGLFMVLIVAGCQGCRGGAQQERGVGANKDSIVQQLDVDDMAADSMVQIRRMMPLVEAQKQKLRLPTVLNSFPYALLRRRSICAYSMFILKSM